jgi:hypothetical protein
VTATELDGPRVYPIRDVDTRITPVENLTMISEHAFHSLMLALVGLETAVSVYFAYRGLRLLNRLERIEGITAAVYLEVRKVLAQSR